MTSEPFFMFNKRKETMKTTFKDLNVKEKIAIISAIAAFCLGWILTSIAAFVPLLLSEQAILWILGQGMTYAAAVFGVSMYFKSEAVQMKDDMQRFFNEKERLQDERFKLKEGLDEGEIPK